MLLRLCRQRAAAAVRHTRVRYETLGSGGPPCPLAADRAPRGALEVVLEEGRRGLLILAAPCDPPPRRTSQGR